MESAKRDYMFFVGTITACVFLSNYSFAVVLECPADGRTWVPLGNNCYCFFHLPKSSTIEDVREACRVNVPSADVVSINSEAENSFVTDYSHRIWNGTKDVWLGMSFNVDTDSLTWFDGLDVVYTNWMHGAYSEDTPVDMCAILHTDSGKWEKVSCEEVSEKAVVCETPMNPPKEKVAANNQALLSAIVILSVVVILVGSTVCWFFYQKKYSSSTVFTPFNYYPPFSTPNSDETVLVDAEERE